MKVISGLNETIGVVLEYLQDAKVIMSACSALLLCS